MSQPKLAELWKRKARIYGTMLDLIGTSEKRGSIHEILSDQAQGYSDEGRLTVTRLLAALEDLEQVNPIIKSLENQSSEFTKLKDSVLIEHNIFTRHIKPAIEGILERKDWHGWLSELEYIDQFMEILKKDILMFKKLIEENTDSSQLKEKSRQMLAERIRLQVSFFDEFFSRLRSPEFYGSESFEESSVRIYIAENGAVLNQNQRASLLFLSLQFFERNLEVIESKILDSDFGRLFDYLNQFVNVILEFRKVLLELKETRARIPHTQAQTRTHHETIIPPPSGVHGNEPEGLSKLEKVGFEILDELDEPAAIESSWAMLPILQGWLLERYGNVSALDVLNTNSRALWGLVFLTEDSVNGILIPNTKFQLSVLLGGKHVTLSEWYVGEGFDGTRSFKRINVVKLAKVQVTEGTLVCTEKGLIDLTRKVEEYEPDLSDTSDGEYTIDEIYSKKQEIMKQITSVLASSGDSRQKLQLIKTLEGQLLDLYRVSFIVHMFCDTVFFDYGELKIINAELMGLAKACIVTMHGIKSARNEIKIRQVTNDLGRIVYKKETFYEMGLRAEIELYYKLKQTIKEQIERFGVRFLKNQRAFEEHMKEVGERYKLHNLRLLADTMEQFIAAFNALVLEVKENSWREQIVHIYNEMNDDLALIKEVLSGSLPLETRAVTKHSLASLRDLVVSVVDLFENQVAIIENPKIGPNIYKMAKLCGLDMIFPKRGDKVDFKTMEFEPIGARSELPKNTVIRTFRVGWFWGGKLFRRARVEISRGSDY